jgi:hypothetical protein
MRFVLPVPDLILRYVACLARLSALDYARASDEEYLHLPYAADEADASRIRARRDGFLAKWAIKKERIADILAPYRCFNQTS